MLREVLNPFSEEALDVVKNSPPIHKLDNSVFDLAFKKLSTEYRRDLIEDYDPVGDVLSFFLLFNLAALDSKDFHGKSRLIKAISTSLISERIWDALGRDHKTYVKAEYTYDWSLVYRLLHQLTDVSLLREKPAEVDLKELKIASQSRYPEDRINYAVPWTELLPTITLRERKLTDFFIINGCALVSLKDIIRIGTNRVGFLLEEYFRTTRKSTNFEINEPRANALKEQLHKVSSSPEEFIHTFMSKVAYLSKSKGMQFEFKGSKSLRPDLFPPCVKLVLDGVSSGSRNYAITVLLTSFISYARIAPVGAKKDARISDYTKDSKVLVEEVLPIIFEAAEHCTPPLLTDQPMEKMNIYYHLGLGMTSEAKLSDAGRSSWYFPPNCDKVRREAPSLCQPDAHCKEIKNPLSYYTKKLFTKKQKINNKKAE